MKFSALIKNISQIHSSLNTAVSKAINISLTIRNWLIGYYIVEFEQFGEDRAKYGRKILENLEKHFKESKIKGFTERRFREYRKFYLTYPEIRLALTADLMQNNTLVNIQSIRRLLTAETGQIDFQEQKVNELLPKQVIHKKKEPQIPPQKLLSNLSFTHFVELIKINDDLKRTFYELECIKGNWSARELDRQIHSLYFERSGLSRDKQKLSAIVNEKTVELIPQDIINSPFAFEFLGLNQRALITESELEQALLDNLQYFLMEMGHGFCFEARQKRILIEDEYYFIDLVFYHRILKCHVLVDLKMKKFKHKYASQLNTYLNYYKDEIKTVNDNPPIGILLCTHKNDILVQYATAGLAENIFVEKYLIELPSKNKLKEYINNELNK
jgi:predicted nuclease of restriction endonuclease-like (RecB) superfamily